MKGLIREVLRVVIAARNPRCVEHMCNAVRLQKRQIACHRVRSKENALCDLAADYVKVGELLGFDLPLAWGDLEILHLRAGSGQDGMVPEGQSGIGPEHCRARAWWRKVGAGPHTRMQRGKWGTAND